MIFFKVITYFIISESLAARAEWSSFFAWARALAKNSGNGARK